MPAAVPYEMLSASNAKGKEISKSIQIVLAGSSVNLTLLIFKGIESRKLARHVQFLFIFAWKSST